MPVHPPAASLTTSTATGITFLDPALVIPIKICQNHVSYSTGLTSSTPNSLKFLNDDSIIQVFIKIQQNSNVILYKLLVIL